MSRWRRHVRLPPSTSFPRTSAARAAVTARRDNEPLPELAAGERLRMEQRLRTRGALVRHFSAALGEIATRPDRATELAYAALEGYCGGCGLTFFGCACGPAVPSAWPPDACCEEVA